MLHYLKWLVFLIKKHVYDKTTSYNHQNLSLSVNYIASYIFTKIFVAAKDPYIICGSYTPMFLDTELWDIKSCKSIIWLQTNMPVT
jgi:hypothetical protein